jgi:hypothetical protein
VVVKMFIRSNLFSEPYGDDACIIISLCDGPLVLFLGRLEHRWGRG